MANSLLKSMTGFAQARAEKNGWTAQLNLRSVNHRFLDLRVRVPEGWESLEPEIRKRIQEKFRRGHIEFSLQIQPGKSTSVAINRELAAAYLEAAKALAAKFRLKSEPDVTAILRLPGVASSAVPEDERETLTKAVLDKLNRALEQLDEMRRIEGQSLGEELTRIVGSVEKITAQVEQDAARLRPAYARKLEGRIKELTGNYELDPARLVQEAALIAERSDTTEELARLKSHAKQFRALLDGGGEVGKKLDFLLQEMQRESNTMLAKASGAERDGLEATRHGLELKSEIEKLREQVQNLE